VARRTWLTMAAAEKLNTWVHVALPLFEDSANRHRCMTCYSRRSSRRRRRALIELAEGSGDWERRGAGGVDSQLRVFWSWHLLRICFASLQGHVVSGLGSNPQRYRLMCNCGISQAGRNFRSYSISIWRITTTIPRFASSEAAYTQLEIKKRKLSISPLAVRLKICGIILAEFVFFCFIVLHSTIPDHDNSMYIYT